MATGSGSTSSSSFASMLRKAKAGRPIKSQSVPPLAAGLSTSDSLTCMEYEQLNFNDEMVKVDEPLLVQHAFDRNSSLDDIKHARDRLFLQFHPDKCGSDAYVPQFQAVNDAYKICSDVIKAIQEGEIWRDGNHRAAASPALAVGAAPCPPAPCLPSSETPCRVCGHVHKTKGQELRSEKRCFTAHGLGPEWNPQHPSLNPAVPCQCHVCVERASKRQRTV